MCSRLFESKKKIGIKVYAIIMNNAYDCYTKIVTYLSNKLCNRKPFFRCDYPYKIDREFFRVHYGEQYALSAFARDGITFRQIIIFRREFGNVNSSEETPKRFW